MNTHVYADHEAMSRAAAQWLAREIQRQPSALMCLATGGTPTRAYDLLAARAARRPTRFRQLRVLKLDEWGGLRSTDPGSSEAYLQQHVVRPLRLGRRYWGFRNCPSNPVAECARVQAWLAAHGPMDLCVLGLGLNGHLAFNEPASFLRPHAHVARLSRASLRHPMVQASRRRPTYGLTLGIADLLQSRRILLLVSGAAKRRPLSRLLAGMVTPQLPATFLWLHPDVTLICDRAAMGD